MVKIHSTPWLRYGMHWITCLVFCLLTTYPCLASVTPIEFTTHNNTTVPSHYPDSTAPILPTNIAPEFPCYYELMDSLDVISNSRPIIRHNTPKLVLHSLKLLPDTTLIQNLKLSHYLDKELNQDIIQSIKEKIVSYYENNGYPFSSVVLHLAVLSDTSAHILGNIHKGNYILLDSLVLHTDTPVRPKFIERHLGYTKGMPYAERYIEAIDEQLVQLEFLDISSPSTIEFLTHSAKIHTSIKPLKSNYFNGLLVFSQNEQQSFEILGELFFDLKNMFGGGEWLTTTWQKLEPKAQLLELKGGVPYALLGKLGLEGQFELEQRDTSFFNLQARFGVNTSINSKNHASIFTSILQGHTNNTTTKAYTSQLLYGCTYHYRNQARNQTKLSYIFKSELALGSRKLQHNEVQHVSLMAQIWLFTNINLPIYRQWNIAITSESGLKNLFSKQNNLLHLNELYSIGGVNSLRGFNEKSIFASSYTILKIEPRFYYTNKEYLCVFYNSAAVSQQTRAHISYATLQGIGAGVTLDLKSSHLAIYYAVGSERGVPVFLLQSSKIHLLYKLVF